MPHRMWGSSTLAQDVPFLVELPLSGLAEHPFNADPPRNLSSGVSPVMFIPQESRNFPELLCLHFH